MSDHQFPPVHVTLPIVQFNFGSLLRNPGLLELKGFCGRVELKCPLTHSQSCASSTQEAAAPTRHTWCMDGAGLSLG